MKLGTKFEESERIFWIYEQFWRKGTFFVTLTKFGNANIILNCEHFSKMRTRLETRTFFKTWNKIWRKRTYFWICEQFLRKGTFFVTLNKIWQREHYFELWTFFENANKIWNSNIFWINLKKISNVNKILKIWTNKQKKSWTFFKIVNKFLSMWTLFQKYEQFLTKRTFFKILNHIWTFQKAYKEKVKKY